MKSNSSIYLLSNSSIFNKETLSNFEMFNVENTYLLYSSLLLNHKEIFDQLPRNIRMTFCFDEKDKGSLPNEFNSNASEIIFYDLSNKHNLLKVLSEKYFNESTNNLLIFSNSIGFSANDIKKVFSLLGMEDETIVVGKSLSNKIVFIGFNSFNPELFWEVEWNLLNYDNFLSKVSKHDNFIHVLGNYMSINNLDDFRNLYSELSKKESLSYCSQNMHERFTNLFIEYKELLK